MQKISELHEHFTSISGSVTKDGVIDKAEFRRALGMKDSLFVERVFTLFDKNGDGAPAPSPRAACSPPTRDATGALQVPSTFGSF